MSELEKLNNERNQLLSDKNTYIKMIEQIEKNILNKGIEISRECSKQNNGHQWTSEREEGPYGERFTYCQKCKVDYYGNYFH